MAILEGDYWKQRVEAIKQEYLNWREYYWSGKSRKMFNIQKPATPRNMECPALPMQESAMVIDDGFFSDICDTLYSHAVPEAMYNFSEFGFNTDGLTDEMKFPEDYSFDQFILNSQNQPHFDQPQIDQNPQIDIIPGTKTEGQVPQEGFHYVEEQLAPDVFEPVIKIIMLKIIIKK